MWWRLTILAAVSVGLLVLLIMPSQTVDIVVGMPRVRGSGSMSAGEMEAVLTGTRRRSLFCSSRLPRFGPLDRPAHRSKARPKGLIRRG